MLSRETRSVAELNVVGNPLWVNVPTVGAHGQSLYRMLNSCVFTEIQPTTLDVRGGILADEMGLGKTAEVMACVLLNPRPEQTCHPLSSQHGPSGRLEEREVPGSLGSGGNGGAHDAGDAPSRASAQAKFVCFCGGEASDSAEPIGVCCLCGIVQHLRCSDWRHTGEADAAAFTCASCVLADEKNQDTETGLVPIKTTLIITPASIAEQWGSEVSDKLAPDLKVMQYRGVKNDGFLRPSTFAQ